MATLSVTLEERKPKTQNALAYGALVIFSVLYFARPEDFIPLLGLVPMEKVTGGIAFLALFLGIRGRTKVSKWPRELKLLGALFVWQFVGIPFSYYISGAFSVVFEKCIKCLIVALIVGLVTESTQQVRRLMFIQAASVAVMTYVSMALYKGGRMGGVLGGVFGNPNDLAISIALNFPLCLMFLMLAKNPLAKLLWFVGIVGMARGLMMTYSRSGFLALAVAIFFSLLEFGIRNKRHYLLVIAGFCVLGLAIAGPQSYGDRIKSIFSNNTTVYGDSREARWELLVLSVRATLHRPIFGVGAGQFAAYSDTPHVTHNTYTELSAESGIPALVLFLLVIGECFRNLSRIRDTALYREDAELPLYTSALWAGFASYLAGAAFASTSYQLFPYFMVGYTTALLRIAREHPVPAEAREPAPREERSRNLLPGWMVARTQLKP